MLWRPAPERSELNASVGADAPPQSATGLRSGLAGLAVMVLAIAALRSWQQTDYIKTLSVMAAIGLAMVLVDLLVYRVRADAANGLSPVPLRAFDAGRTVRKLTGLWLTIGVIAAFYWLLPVYADRLFDPFKRAALFCLPALALSSPFYIGYVDRLQREPDDAYAALGDLLAGRWPADWSALAAHARGWAIKAFFLPLMFVYTNNDLAALWSRAPLLPAGGFEHLFSLGIDVLFLTDVLFASVAYTLTLRLTNSHIRSAEPTVSGWLVCLVCYYPFWSQVGVRYLGYDQDNTYWGHFFAPYPLLYGLWGGVILVLVAIYAWSTVVFGLRFSNLTNRGIITSGPYRWVKHPAYLCKNVSFWMISVPFLSGSGWSVAVQSCLLLAGLNGLYWLRAITEERHLSADPDYRAYRDFIAREGLWAVLRRRLFRSRFPA
jgi:protein-S-isoprenylcysteine O-methyltransferase Ste14